MTDRAGPIYSHPDTRAAQIADEILDLVGIDPACEVLEQCRRSDDDDDDEGGEPVCWHDFDEFGSRDEWPRLHHLLEELDQLVDWEPEEEDALAEFIGDRWDAHQKEKEARAKAARNRRARA